ncbi:AAA family ATPase [Streptacidiphilus albus]|uniref:AAA family ATPase n=1 Tax=Streptacidiphilus albus TaxID=105425 RepID=UPI00054C5573|nr:AAA family ATPase [Streptacidiphilus albus]
MAWEVALLRGDCARREVGGASIGGEDRTAAELAVRGDEDRLWPERIGPGDRLLLDDLLWTVRGIDGPRLVLEDEQGGKRESTLLRVLAAGAQFADAGTTEPASARDRLPTPGSAAWAKAQFWERHILEVISGRQSGAGAPGVPRPGYDVRATTLEQREATKAEELSQMPWPGAVSARTVRRKRLRYQAQGLRGLLDGRVGRTEANGARVNPVILELLYTQALERTPGRISAERLHRFLVDEVQRNHPDLVGAVPSRSTIRRIIGKAIAADPRSIRRGAWGLSTQQERRRPGELVEVDALLFDLRTPGGGRVPLKLTVAVDTATSLLLAAVVHLPSSLPDAMALLVRMCTPRQLIPGVEESGDPAALERSYVRPRRLVLDRGPLARSTALRSACRGLGLDLVVRGKLASADRPRPEQAAFRLRPALETALKAQSLWPGLPEPEDSEAVRVAVQCFVDRWIPAVWQPTVVRDPETLPGRSGRGRSSEVPYVDVPYPPQDTLPLLPSMWRQVTHYGVNVRGRRYDGAVLDRLRPSPGRQAAEQAGRVRVSVDSTDPERVWIQLPQQGWAAIPQVGQASSRRPATEPSLPRPLPTSAVSGGTSDTATRAATHSGPVLPGQQARAQADDFWGPPGSDGYCARLAHHAQLVLVDTPLAEAVRERAQTLLVMNVLQRTTEGRRRVLLVTGAPGIGKTTALRAFARGVEERERAENPGRRDLTPVLYTQVRPGGGVRQYLADALQSLGVPGGRRSTWDLCDLLRDELLQRGTRVVIVDDAGSLGRRAGGDLEVLRHLADQVPALFMVAAVGLDVARTQQVAARYDHVQGGPVPPGPAWERLVRALEDQLRLRHHRPGTLAERADLLHTRTRGVVGDLVGLVTRAAIEVLQDGSEDLVRRLDEGQPGEP